LSGLHFANFYQNVPPVYFFAFLIFYVLCGLIASILIALIYSFLASIQLAYKITLAFAYLWVFYYLHAPNVYGWIVILLLVIFPIPFLSGWEKWTKGNLFPLNSS